MPTINATFETRREAELAVEHLVQDHEIDREAITIGTDGDENSVGETLGGSDAADEDVDDDDAALNGSIAISVSVDSEDEADTVLDVLHEYGGADVTQDD